MVCCWCCTDWYSLSDCCDQKVMLSFKSRIFVFKLIYLRICILFLLFMYRYITTIVAERVFFIDHHDKIITLVYICYHHNIWSKMKWWCGMRLVAVKYLYYCFPLKVEPLLFEIINCADFVCLFFFHSSKTACINRPADNSD